MYFVILFASAMFSDVVTFGEKIFCVVKLLLCFVEIVCVNEWKSVV